MQWPCARGGLSSAFLGAHLGTPLRSTVCRPVFNCRGCGRVGLARASCVTGIVLNEGERLGDGRDFGQESSRENRRGWADDMLGRAGRLSWEVAIWYKALTDPLSLLNEEMLNGVPKVHGCCNGPAFPSQ